MTKPPGKRSFLSYYSQYRHKIFNYIFYRLDFNRHLAEDLVSEIFLKAFKKFDSFTVEISFQAWIYKISKNHLINYYKTMGREVSIDAAFEIPDNALGNLSAKITLDQIRKTINGMDEYSKEVLLLRFFEGLSNSEIAAVLDKEEGAIRTQISRALSNLRGKITEYE